MVSQWDVRLQSLRESMPAGLDRVGYVDTSMITEDPAAFDLEEFFLMQYSIAPVALRTGVDEEWIIGNFSNDLPYRNWLDARMGEYEIQYLGFDLHLIHKLDH